MTKLQSWILKEIQTLGTLCYHETEETSYSKKNIEQMPGEQFKVYLIINKNLPHNGSRDLKNSPLSKASPQEKENITQKLPAI